MGGYFLDTSALIKRHVTEPGHTWVESLCDPNAGNILVISEAAITEVIATFCRMVRENPPRLNLADRDTLITIFETLVQQRYVVVQVNRAMFVRAAGLCRTHNLRAYDAVQLACAATFRDDEIAAVRPAPTFVSADNALLGVAALEGFPIENPNRYP